MFHRLLIAGLLPIACVASSLTASSQVCVVTFANCTVGPQGTAGGVFTGATGVGSATQDVGSNSQGTFWGATAGATLDYGFFRGEATADLTSQVLSPGAFIQSLAGGIQSETWTIHDPSGVHAAGSPGLYQISYTVSGTSSAAAGPDGNADAYFVFMITMNGPVYTGSQSSVAIRTSGIYSLTAPLRFQYDVPTSVLIQYSVNAGVGIVSASPLFDAHAGGSFEHTAILTGIQALDFSTQAPVFGTVLTSDSGTTYPLGAAAVPEPGTLGLLAGGLAVLLLRRIASLQRVLQGLSKAGAISALCVATAFGGVVASSLQTPFRQTVQVPVSATQSEPVTLTGKLEILTLVLTPTDPCTPGEPCRAVPVAMLVTSDGISGVGPISGRRYQAIGVSPSFGQFSIPGPIFANAAFRLTPPNPIIPPDPIKALVYVNINAQGTATSASSTPPGLVSWWKGEGDGQDALGANPGTINGTMGFTQGRVGQAFDFLPNSFGYVQAISSPSLQPQTLSVAAWVKHAGYPGVSTWVASKGGLQCISPSYGLYTGESAAWNMRFIVFDGQSFVESPGAPPAVWDGNWHHVVGTYDGASVRLYMDGVEVGPGTPTHIPINYFLADGSNFYIGAYRGTCDIPFLGSVDEVQLYNRALIPAEVQALFQSVP